MLIVEDTSTGLRASVSFDRWDGDRAQYRWTLGTIGYPDDDTSGDDLRMGSGAEPTDAEALHALLGFFGAYAEAVEYQQRTGTASDNAHLFPESLRDLAYGLGSDRLAMIAIEALGDEA